MTKFKLNKARRRPRGFVIGNLMFSSVRNLRREQSRFHDDVEAMLYVAYYFIAGDLPWEKDFRRYD